MNARRREEEYTFGELLRIFRNRVSYTQQQLAEDIGVDRNSILAWEKAQYSPKTKYTIVAIQRVLGLTDVETDALLYVTHKFDKEHKTPDSVIASLVSKTTQEPTSRAFSFGPLEVPEIILDGNGELAYARGDIIIHYDENDRLELEPELAALKEEVTKEQAAKKLAGEHTHWNGPITFLDRWTRGRTIKGEHPTLELWFGLTDYYTYLATNMSLYERKVFDKKTGRLQTLFNTYLADYDWSDPFLRPAPYFSNIFGVVISLITGDNKLIIGRRPKNIGGHAGVLNIAINESVHPEKDRKDSHLLDIYNTAKRGTKEELGFHLTELKFLTFAVDTHRSMWSLMGVAKTNLTADEVIQGRKINAIDKFENHGVYKVDFDTRSVCEFIDTMTPPNKRHSMVDVWSPGAPPCMYYALVDKYGTQTVNQEIGQYFRYESSSG